MSKPLYRPLNTLRTVENACKAFATSAALVHVTFSTSGLAFCNSVEHGSELPHEDKTTWCSANEERKICSRARSSMGFITSVCVHCTIARGAVADGDDTNAIDGPFLE
jgi:hypothetical protein